MYYFCRPKSNLYESNLDNTAACGIKHIHDLCMVRTPETPGDEDIIQLAINFRHPIFMVRGVFRILCAGAGKQDRICRKRRSLQPDAVEGHSGSDIPDSIYTDRNGHVQRTKSAMEPHSSLLLPDYGCIFRFLEIIKQKKHKKVWRFKIYLYLCNPKTTTLGSYNG